MYLQAQRVTEVTVYAFVTKLQVELSSEFYILSTFFWRNNARYLL
jgi:hypothetical protein